MYINFNDTHPSTKYLAAVQIKIKKVFLGRGGVVDLVGPFRWALDFKPFTGSDNNFTWRQRACRGRMIIGFVQIIEPTKLAWSDYSIGISSFQWPFHLTPLSVYIYTVFCANNSRSKAGWFKTLKLFWRPEIYDSLEQISRPSFRDKQAFCITSLFQKRWWGFLALHRSTEMNEHFTFKKPEGERLSLGF